MDCKISPESFVDFHFGKIVPAERSRVEEHLASCPECLQEYFSLKRDLEAAAPSEKPSELVKYRIKKDFAAYCESLISAGSREWLYSNRVRIAVGLVAIAAAVLLIIYSGQLRLPVPDRDKPSYDTHELRSLDEAVDSGRLSPGHINMI